VPERNDLRQFLLFIFALLVPCFALWTVASGALAIPVIGLVNLALTHWFPDVVHALYSDGGDALLMTQFGEEGGRPVPPSEAEYRLGFSVNTQLLSYSLPFYTALHFATPREDYLGAWLRGLLVLYPLIALGLLCVCLKELMVGLGAHFLEQPGVLVPDANLIGILYQVNVLLVPTLAPAMVWLWQSRDTALLRGVLGGLATAGQGQSGN